MASLTRDPYSLAVRTAFLLAALFLLATFVPRKDQPPQPIPARTLLAFERVPLDRSDPGRERLGALLFRAGWSISSNDHRFGGVSAMHVEQGRVMAVSDSGSVIRFALPGQRPEARIQAFPQGPGSIRVKADRDSESLVVQGTTAWVGFERSNAVWRYDVRSLRATGGAAPRSMRKWRGNRGSEAILRLRDGRFLVFSEGNGGISEVIAFDGDPALPGTRSVRLGYRPPVGYRITDAALLPDGRALFLNRRFRLLEGPSAKLTMARLPRLVSGAILEGAEVADFRNPVTVDNMEALSVSTEAGRPIVWIASDDNFNPLQQTLLLKFELAEASSV